MNDKKKRRYTLDFDETESRPRKKSARSVSQDSRTTRPQTPGFDTDRISRTLESQADEHVTRSRREIRYSTGPVSPSTSSRRPHVSSYEEEETRTAPEEREVEIDESERRYKERRRLRREAARWKRMHWVVRFLILIVLLLDILVLRFGVFKGGFMPVLNILRSSGKETTAEGVDDGPQFTIYEDYLTVNEYSRPGTKLDAVNGIVIHYIGNPGTDAQANKDYFENLKDGSTGIYASANYIIGIDGTIIHCVPDDEVAYASGERNNDTISIECCHPDDSGAFTTETFNALVLLTAKLCTDYNLTTDNILRHYDVNGKPCPRFFVDIPDAWESFLASVDACLQ